MQNEKIIIWDFNGTLIDDTQICIDAINLLLKDRNKSEIDRNTYRSIFTFPVRDYYVKAGFDFTREEFEKPAMEFIAHYDRMIRDAGLFEDVRPTLEELRKKGYSQMILSAMQQDFLDSLIDEHGIRDYFTRISGIDNHYADGKLENARKLLSSVNGLRQDVILVGDTLHDYEVGKELGIRVILVSRGHQSAERLRQSGCVIAGSLREAIQYI